jgi:hypothetical protein
MTYLIAHANKRRNEAEEITGVTQVTLEAPDATAARDRFAELYPDREIVVVGDLS